MDSQNKVEAQLQVTKVCIHCNEEKELNLLVTEKNCSYGKKACCKKCAQEKQKARRKLNPEKYRSAVKSNKNYSLNTRKANLKKNYGISLEDYDLLLKSQNNSCAICNTHISELNKPLFVDHDHKTGAVRGLLCHHCNAMLGYARDNIQNLLNATEYLQR